MSYAFKRCFLHSHLGLSDLKFSVLFCEVFCFVFFSGEGCRWFYFGLVFLSAIECLQTSVMLCFIEVSPVNKAPN